MKKKNKKKDSFVEYLGKDDDEKKITVSLTEAEMDAVKKFRENNVKNMDRESRINALQEKLGKIREDGNLEKAFEWFDSHYNGKYIIQDCPPEFNFGRSFSAFKLNVPKGLFINAFLSNQYLLTLMESKTVTFELTDSEDYIETSTNCKQENSIHLSNFWNPYIDPIFYIAQGAGEHATEKEPLLHIKVLDEKEFDVIEDLEKTHSEKLTALNTNIEHIFEFIRLLRIATDI